MFRNGAKSFFPGARFETFGLGTTGAIHCSFVARRMMFRSKE
jgi:hypothetical protein